MLCYTCIIAQNVNMFDSTKIKSSLFFDVLFVLLCFSYFGGDRKLSDCCAEKKTKTQTQKNTQHIDFNELSISRGAFYECELEICNFWTIARNVKNFNWFEFVYINYTYIFNWKIILSFYKTTWDTYRYLPIHSNSKHRLEEHKIRRQANKR